ncbi:19908_t:CDS:2 [Gigaspora margarita]|uniref:19908_t:CDS:1 n=1 Tax=Gigaspora margarita TaxID=4874 RepID=A0ABN7W7J4_GIGMA|nr:19908_t:CDS:2 [Gigaspora margarita]
MALSQLQFNNSCGIPENFNLFYVYNPDHKYDTFTLMSTKPTNQQKVKKNSPPPRPPNVFFLFKNCFMLEFKFQQPALFEKLSMPNLCKYAQKIWKTIPEEVKSKYNKFAVEAQSIHNELYPDYIYQPRKKKGRASNQEDNLMEQNMITFSSTNLLSKRNRNVYLPPPLMNLFPSEPNMIPIVPEPLFILSPEISPETSPIIPSPIINPSPEEPLFIPSPESSPETSPIIHPLLEEINCGIPFSYEIQNSFDYTFWENMIILANQINQRYV